MKVVVADAQELRILLAEAVREALGQRASADGWVDAHGSGLGYRTFLRLAREEAFPVSLVGKKYMARRSDVDAYIESQRVHAVAKQAPLEVTYSDSPSTTTGQPHDPIAEALEAGRLRRVK